MFGFYGDGTIGIAKILKKPFNYCLTEQISKTLLIRFIKLQLKREFDNI